MPGFADQGTDAESSLRGIPQPNLSQHPGASRHDGPVAGSCSPRRSLPSRLPTSIATQSPAACTSPLRGRLCGCSRGTVPARTEQKGNEGKYSRIQETPASAGASSSSKAREEDGRQNERNQRKRSQAKTGEHSRLLLSDTSELYSGGLAQLQAETSEKAEAPDAQTEFRARHGNFYRRTDSFSPLEENWQPSVPHRRGGKPHASVVRKTGSRRASRGAASSPRTPDSVSRTPDSANDKEEPKWIPRSGDLVEPRQCKQEPGKSSFRTAEIIRVYEDPECGRVVDLLRCNKKSASYRNLRASLLK